MSRYDVKSAMRGQSAAVYMVDLPSGHECAFRCYNIQDREGVAYIYEKDKRWYVAGVDPIGQTRTGKYAGLQTAPARLKERKCKTSITA